MNVTHPVNNQIQGFLVISHTTKKKHHLWYQISFLTDVIRLDITESRVNVVHKDYTCSKL